LAKAMRSVLSNPHPCEWPIDIALDCAGDSPSLSHWLELQLHLALEFGAASRKAH
jgi:hypothetical protein